MSHHQQKKNRPGQKRGKKPQQKSPLKRYKSEELPIFQLQVERPEANERQRFIAVPDFASDNPQSTMPRSPEGSNGIYRVMFVLGVPGKELFLEHLNVDTLRQSGTSLLILPQGAPFARVQIYHVSDTQDKTEVLFSAGKDGRLANAQMRIHASTFIEAERVAFNLFMPILSRWSYEHDVALDVKYYEILEEQTLVQKWVFNLLGKAKPLGVNLKGLSQPEFRMVFAAYREAVSATNVFYQLLCFYKVIEGVNKIRAKRKEVALAAGLEYRNPSDERIPRLEDDLGISNEYLREPFRPHLGQKFTKVLDEFSRVLRNAIAHLDPEGDSLIADEFDDVIQCERAVPVIKYISRIMLGNELQVNPDLALVPVN